MPRILFGQLVLVALVTWALRQRMAESQVCAQAQQKVANTSVAMRELLGWRHVRTLGFLIVMYGVWNLVAGTYGFFYRYILEAVGTTSGRATYGLQAVWFVSTALAVAGIYMRLVDRLSRRTLLLASTIAQVAAFLPFAFLPFVFFKVSLAWALLNVILFGLGAGIGQQSLFQLWSGELFPTLLRSTAQGVMFGIVRIVRIGLGGWSLLLPTVQHAGFRVLAHHLRAGHAGTRPRRDTARQFAKTGANARQPI